MTQAVADVRLHSNLIDDYLYIEDAPVAPGPPGSFVAVQDGPAGRSHLLAIDSSGSLLHFAPDATSASGWRITAVPVPAPVGVTAGIVSTATFFSAGTLNALCQFPAPQSYPVNPGGYAVAWMTRTAAGQWSQPSLTAAAQSMLSLCSQVDHYVDPSGNAYVYGVVPPVLGGLQGPPGYLAPQSAVFFVLYFDAADTVWDVLYQTEVSALNAAAPVTFQILSGGSGAPTLLWVDPKNIQWQQATLAPPSQGGFEWIGNLDTLPFGSIAINGVARILRFPGTSSVDVVLIIDNSETLYLAQFQSGYDFPILIQLTGMGGAPAGAVVASLTQIGGSGADFPLFVVESGTNALWIARRYGGDTPSQWVNLGNHVGAIAVPASTPGGPELFCADLQDRVLHLSQDLTDTVWVTRKIAAPVPSTSAPARTSSMATHAAALDSNGGPVPNAIFTVESDLWVNLIVDALSYWAGPATPAVFAADATGRATVTFQAASLAMPKLTFSAVSPGAGGTSGAAQRWCQGDVIEVKPAETAIPVSTSSVASRLAGNDKLFTLDEQTLTSAGLLNPQFQGGSDAVSNITQIGQWMLAQVTPPSQAAAGPAFARHWRFEFAPGSASCRELTAASPRAGAPGGFFSDIFGDVANWAKHAAGELTSITISIGTSFEIAFNDVASFVVSTVRQAGEALEVIFVHVVQGLEDVIAVLKDIVEFLMLLFKWQDILHTHDVISKMITSLIDKLDSSAGDLRTLLTSQFSSLTSRINGELGKIGSNPAFTQSFNQFANGQPSSLARVGTAPNVLAYPSGNDAFNHHLPRCLYVYSHAKSVPLTGAAGAGSAAVDISGISGAVTASWNTDQMIAAKQKFLQSISSKHGGYGQLLDFGISELVGMVQELIDLVLAGAEAVLGAILDAVPAVIAAFKEMFEGTIDIPVVSFIYKLLTGNDLSLLDLFCLICAVPVTILYKVLNDGQAPFAAGDADRLVLPWPDPGQDGLARLGAPTDLSVYQKLGYCGTVMYLLNAFIAPVCDGMAFDAPPPGLLPTFVTWTSNLAAFTALGFQAPWSTWIADRPANSADIMTSVLWALGGVPVVYDSAFGLATGELARFLSVIGPILDGCSGIVLLAAGIATGVVQAVEGAAEGYTGWDTANSIVPQLARPFRFLILDQDNPTTPVSMAALITVDILISGAAAFTQFTSTAEG